MESMIASFILIGFLIFVGFILISPILVWIFTIYTDWKIGRDNARALERREVFSREQDAKRRMAEREARRDEIERQNHERDRVSKIVQNYRTRARAIDVKYNKISAESQKHYSRIPKEKREILEQLAMGKKYCVMPDGKNRDSIMAYWAKYSGKKKILIVTSPEKANDFLRPFSSIDKWCGKMWYKMIDDYEVVTWGNLWHWYCDHSKTINEKVKSDIGDYAIIFDEVHYAKRGYMSNRGMAFMDICSETDNWIGLSAQIGNRWGNYATFFVAAKVFKNEVDFESKYAHFSYTPNGGKYISGYYNTEELLEVWRNISVDKIKENRDDL